jgi:pyruvate dehydrogenase E1 component alpha subunit
MNNLVDLYKQMVYIRLFQNKLIDFVNKWFIKIPMHLSIGQEAISVWISSLLEKKDHMYWNHRSIIHYLAKWGNPEKLLLELLGSSGWCSGGVWWGMHLTDKECWFMATSSIVWWTIGVAVGDALIQKISRTSNMVVVLFWEWACNEWITYEAVNFSVLHKLPIVFACENNGYATHKKINTHLGNNKVYKIFKWFNINCYQCNWNDITLVVNLMNKVKWWIRTGHWPIFIEFITYRINGHVSVKKNFDLLWRNRKEVNDWKKKCPIKNLENLFINMQYSKKAINNIKKEIQDKINYLFDFIYQKTTKC